MVRLVKALILSGMLSSYAAWADFLRYQQTEENDQVQFFYQWRDAEGKDKQLAFSYFNETLYDSFRGFTAFQPKILRQYVENELTKMAAQAPINVDVRLRAEFDRLSVSIKSTDAALVDEWQEKLQQRQQEATEELLKSHYYNQLIDRNGNELGIKPDHVRFILESTEDLEPVVDAIKREFGETRITARVLLNYLLSFTQSIPYSTLEDRATSSGKGFSPPTHLIYNNEGDCDSKSTLLASIFRAFFPKLEIVVIYLRNHALLAARLPIRNSDETVFIDEQEYVLLEPTGPALMSVGEIAPTSESEIYSEQFAFEKVPLVITRNQ